MRQLPAVRRHEASEAEVSLISLGTGTALAASNQPGGISHNLAGQKLGRKGRDTRERIIAATAELIEEAGETPISMSAVARRASLGMTSLYNYFADFTELMLALLEPVMASAEDAYLARLRTTWSDAELGARCLEFVTAYHGFWARNSRLLHLRNAISDQLDPRLMRHRIGSTQPIVDLLVRQMGGITLQLSSSPVTLATMAMIAIERSITISTDHELSSLTEWFYEPDDDRFVVPGARLLELAIREGRAVTQDTAGDSAAA
jgi:AcrR family transcriptional regulator